jgi:hypothetical protein
MGVDLQELTNTNTSTSQDEPIFTHIIRGDGKRSASAIIMEAMANGTPVTALCGYTWVPSRNPEKHPVCQKCEEILAFDRQF